jgi:hypothetical protein
MLNTTHTYEFRLVLMSKHMNPATTTWRPGAARPLHLDPLVINEAVTIFLFSLRHGPVLSRTRWDELPMPQDVIDRVSAIGYLQGSLKL